MCGPSGYKGMSMAAGNWAGTADDTADRATLIAWGIIGDGYNTNYAASYYLVRSNVRTARMGNSLIADIYYGPAGAAAQKGLAGSQGPLTQSVAESGLVPTSNIPLLGDAAPGDLNESPAKATFERKDNDWIGQLLTGTAAAEARGSKTYIPAGALTTEAFNDGPAFWNGTRVGLIDSGFTTGAPGTGPSLSAQLAAEAAGAIASPTGPTGNNLYLQDTRDWYCLHGGTRNATCNILMADGSVKSFADTNGDGFLNPGFDVASGLTTADYLEIGYKDSTLELPPGEIFSGMFLYKLTKGRLEAQ
jgi:prepilin-type processing-associated H-X9-DG protein